VKSIELTSSIKEGRPVNNQVHILIADDDDQVARSMVRLLAKEHYLCDCVDSGEEALARLSSGQYNVLVADIKMPGNSHLELVEKAQAIARGVPIILVTGYPSLDTAVKSVSLPVYDYLLKPFEPERFVSCIRNAVQWNQAYLSLLAVKHDHIASNSTAASMLEFMQPSQHISTRDSVQAVVALTFSRIAGAMTDLHNLVSAMQGENNTKPVCNIMQCPRMKTVDEAIEKSIAELRASKGAFKSKEIASVRRSLEELLQEKHSEMNQIISKVANE
jgi:DNA-binding response OmpR family regulator